MVVAVVVVVAVVLTPAYGVALGPPGPWEEAHPSRHRGEGEEEERKQKYR